MFLPPAPRDLLPLPLFAPSAENDTYVPFDTDLMRFIMANFPADETAIATLPVSSNALTIGDAQQCENRTRIMSNHSEESGLGGIHKKRLKRKRKRVTFDLRVGVEVIPARSDYPSDIKNALWSNKSELKRSKARNRLEFAAEGENWRQATEEADMFEHPITGKMIHPIHVYIHFEKKKRPLSKDDIFDPIFLSSFAKETRQSALRSVVL